MRQRVSRCTFSPWPGTLFQTKLSGKVDVLKGVATGVLLEVGTGGVAALGIFKIQNRVPLIAHSGDHLSCVTGVHPVVLGRCFDENFRVFTLGEYILVRRIFEDSRTHC